MKNNLRRVFRFVVFPLALCVAALAVRATVSAGLLDDLPELQGKVVAYAGEFELLTCPVGGKYDCLSWPSDFFRTTRSRDFCFVARGYVRCSYTCKGLIAIGDDKRVYAFFIEQISGDLKKSEIENYKCPDRY